MTVPFFADLENSEDSMKEKLSKLAKHISSNAPKDKINLVLFEASPEDYKTFAQIIREVKLKSTLVLQTSNLQGIENFLEDENQLTCFILENLKEITNFYFYGSQQGQDDTEQIANLHSLKFFLGEELGDSSKESFPTRSRPKFPLDENLKENIHPNQMMPPKNQTLADMPPPSNFDITTTNPAFYKSQPFKHVEIRDSRKYGQVFQQELMNFANKGELLIPKETLLKKLKDSLQLKSLDEAESVLMEAEAKKLIHITIRKFPNNDPYYYIGMLLNVLTIESLVWIIRSIKSDLMTPTEKLILSRIKECYGLKIDPNYWKMLLYSLHQNTLAGRIDVRQILDPVTNLETTALYLANEDWVPEDQGQVLENSEEWKVFLRFIEGFFDDEEDHFDAPKKEAETSSWNNSVENVLSRPSVGSEKVLKVSEDTKAIPGGRYGCAQFIKYCGPRALKDLSIGRLSLLVQEAINKGILRYQRTLLVKNTSSEKINTAGLESHSDFQIEVLQSLNTERKAKIISMVKEALLEILMENPNGISLAQIPFHLKRKLRFTVDFQDLGFAKLKNFLSTLKNLVVIQSVGTNHTYVKLRGPIPKQSFSSQLGKNLQQQQQPRKRFGDVDKSQPQSHFYAPPKVQQQQPNFVEPVAKNRPPLHFGSLGTDFQILKERIQMILSRNMGGIPLQNLYQEICNELKIENLNLKPFGCDNLYDFLIVHLEEFVDVGAQKQGLIVYPKNCYFGGNNWMAVNPYQTREQQQPYYRNQSRDFQNDMKGPHQLFRNQQQQIHMSMCNEGSTLNSSFSSHNKTFGSCVDSSNFLSMSPIIFSESDIQEDCSSSEQMFASKNPNVNVSTWSLNQQQKFMPRRQAPKEEDLPENLRFIEELLQENEEKKNFERRPGNFNTESFYTAPMQQMNQKRFPSFYTNMS